MAKIVKIGGLATILEQRISARLKQFAPGSPPFAAALHRIGIMVQREAIQNIRRKHIVDTGALMNSIQYRLYGAGAVAGVAIGSYGVPYAAAHEFGFDGMVTVRPVKARTSAFGKPTKPYIVPPYVRNQHTWARPYLGPAVRTMQAKIIEILRDLARYTK